MFHNTFYSGKQSAFVAQSDACPSVDQVAGWIPSGSGDILSWEMAYEILSMVILSLLLIQERQLSVSDERMCTVLVNFFEN